MVIKNKAEFSALSQHGKLGNYLRTWKTLPEAYSSGSPWLTIQGTVPQSPYFVPVVQRSQLLRTVHSLYQRGANPSAIYFREIPHPDALRVINGEAGRSLMPHWLYLLHGAMGTKQNLRHDLQENGRTVVDSRAQALLRHWLAEEYNTLEEIWEDYPDAVVEFTMWNQPCGVLNKRLMIWEVRNF